MYSNIHLFSCNNVFYLNTDITYPNVLSARGRSACADDAGLTLLFFRPYIDRHVSCSKAIGQFYGQIPVKIDYLPILTQEVGFVTIGLWKE